MKSAYITICIFYLLFLSSCSRFYSTAHKNISYAPEKALQLDLFSPKKKSGKPAEVLVFIHGGNWYKGSKRLYRFFGRGMARKGVVTAVIDYRLYPAATYAGMAMDAAQSLKWLKDNVASYGGDPDKIFVSGHSAGGHLAALISTDNSYFDTLQIKNPIKGCILIDPAGLNMYKYLRREDKYKYELYRNVFTKDTAEWKKASPELQLHKGMPPFLLFTGKKTYPNIITGAQDFLQVLKPFQPDADIIAIPGKDHHGMIFSYLNPRYPPYRQVLEFMKKRGN
jgi:acetyl esterase/lipase